MQKWKYFEEQCTKYLQEEFGEFAEFDCEGGSDSTVSDILVYALFL